MSSDQENYACGESGARPDDQRTLRVRQLNDELRKTMTGGQIMITPGIEALGLMSVTSILRAVREHDQFSAANDPHGEHDFGALTCLGHRIFWKIDCYDYQLEFASPDPANPHITVRVLTIMLASEY